MKGWLVQVKRYEPSRLESGNSNVPTSLGFYRNKEHAQKRLREYFLDDGLLYYVWSCLNLEIGISETIPQILEKIPEFSERSRRNVSQYLDWYGEFKKEFYELEELDILIPGYEDRGGYIFWTNIEELEIE